MQQNTSLYTLFNLKLLRRRVSTTTVPSIFKPRTTSKQSTKLYRFSPQKKPFHLIIFLEAENIQPFVAELETK